MTIHPGGDGVKSAGEGFVGLLFVDVNMFTDILLDEEFAQGYKQI